MKTLALPADGLAWGLSSWASPMVSQTLNLPTCKMELKIAPHLLKRLSESTETLKAKSFAFLRHVKYAVVTLASRSSFTASR